MPLTAGARLGPYEILSALDAGGMGEVYRARDLRLDRDVAIKVLPSEFALDADRLARFKREAQVLASLNHSNIAAIYGFEVGGDTQALVLELVEGETLGARLARGPISHGEALPIAREICDALAAAHEQGIIHRDLKPSNIKITPDGLVKVLDFGLAKTAAPAEVGTHVRADITASPTITSPGRVTGIGVILGTAAYMAPEQAQGRPTDKRADIWAFGCVLFEMLAGKRPFDGDDATDTIANILKIDPDWTALPADVPIAIRALLQGCLEKDRRRRIGDIAAAQFALAQSARLGAPDRVTPPVLPSSRPTLLRRAGLLAVAVFVGATAASGVTFLLTRPTPAPVTRMAIPAFGAAAMTIDQNDRTLAIAPDGLKLAYIGGGNTRLFVRAMDQLDATSLAGPGQTREPFFSPDGDWIGFFFTNRLQKVAVTGGPPVTLVSNLNGASRGATWGADGTIIFATNNSGSGLQQISANGGEPKVLTRPDRTKGERGHFWPEFLPGGQAVLFTIAPAGSIDDALIAVLDLRTGTQKVVIRGGSDAHYVPSGHLVYGVAGTLRAVAFDPARFEATGVPVPVLPQLVTTPTDGAANFAITRDGTLAYLSGGTGSTVGRTLVWVDRQGREELIKMPVRAYVIPRISPDGRHVASDVRDQQGDIWIWDFARGTLTRSTLDPGADGYPVWTPNGRRLIFGSERTHPGIANVFWQAADGTSPAESLTQGDRPQTPWSISPDGTLLLFGEGGDLASVSLESEHRVQMLTKTPSTERNGEISPDGRWIAYESDESGQFEIYVRPFPKIDTGRWQISTAGGTRPVWAKNGQELFYMAPLGALMSCAD